MQKRYRWEKARKASLEADKGFIEKVDSEKYDRKKQDISKNIISELDNMLSAEVPTDEHPECESNTPWDDILSCRENTEECTNKPKYRKYCSHSLCLERGESYDKSIDKIIPHSRPCDEEIPDHREEKKSYIVHVFSFLWDVDHIFPSCLFIIRDDRQSDHRDSRDAIDDIVRYREDQIRSEKTSSDRDDRASDDEFLGYMSIFIEQVESSEDISDLSEFESDTGKLRGKSKYREKPDWEDRNSSWWKTPEIRREESDNEDDEYFDFFGHSYSSVNTFSVP